MVVFRQLLILVSHPVVVEGRGRILLLSTSGEVIPASPAGWSDPPAFRLQVDGQGALYIDGLSIASAVGMRNLVRRQLAPSGILAASADETTALVSGGSLPGEVTVKTASLAASPWLSGLLHMSRRASQEPWSLTDVEKEWLENAAGLRALLSGEINIPSHQTSLLGLPDHPVVAPAAGVGSGFGPSRPVAGVVPEAVARALGSDVVRASIRVSVPTTTTEDRDSRSYKKVIVR